MNRDLVSIIIPTYNRAHLINETLDSIINQTYSNWECLVVDDGSTDNTKNILKEYISKDKRFKYFQRPKDRPKGANACRNYGLEKSKGDFINFFDSDDLMMLNKINLKLSKLLKSNADYVISKTIDFNHPNSESLFIASPTNYNFREYPITHFNYVSQKLNWLTPDVLMRSNLTKQICFNENLKRGQEYNFYVKLTLLSENGVFLDEFLTKRRLHQKSIKNQFTQNQINKQAITLRFNTLVEVYGKTTNDVKKWFVQNIIKNITRVNLFLDFKRELFLIKSIYHYFGIMAVIYTIFSRLLKYFIGRNEFFRIRLKRYLL